MKKSIIYILLAITFILAVAAIVPWVFIGYGVYKVADTSEKVSDAIEKALDTPSKGSGSSRAREFHPHPLTEPCVKVSPHTALHTQLFVHRHNLGV